MTENVESFGVTTDTKSKNSTPFTGGIHRAYITEIKKEEIGKDTKYNVLTFLVSDVEGIRTYRHSEFIPTIENARLFAKQGESEQDALNRMKNMLNVRIKHIWEAFAPFPASGVGVGAASWDDFFQKVSDAFNTGREGKSIFTKDSGDKQIPVSVWLKLVYNKKNSITMPMSPNFIEKITEATATTPKTIVIDKKFDKIEQSATITDPTAKIMGAGTNDGGLQF